MSMHSQDAVSSEYRRTVRVVQRPPVMPSSLQNTHTIAHTTLKSSVTGVSDGVVVAFSGVPYGRVTKRWTYATRRDDLPPTYCATSHGPRCVQRHLDVSKEYGPRLEHPPISEHEFECLNLNIVTPVKSTHLLPIYVYFHGGANLHGSASEPACDPASLVAWSIEYGKPIMVIAVNWRYGTFGLLYSSDLDHVNEDPLYRGNYSLHDQSVALDWIQHHIAGFGGDPTRVTIAGQSSGGYSTHAQIAADTHLADQPRKFARAIIQSGPLASRHIWSMQRYDRAWHAMLAGNGVTESTPEGRVEAMRAVKAEDLMLSGYRDANVYTWGYFMDGVFCPPEFYDERREFRTIVPRADAILIGDNADERSVFLTRCKREGIKKLARSLSATLGSEAAEILAMYGLTEDSSTSDPSVVDAMSHCAQHMRYWMPTDALTDSWPTSFRYHLALPSPFDESIYKGLASHSIDHLYLFRNWNDHLAERGMSQHLEMTNIVGRLWVDFVNGELSWPNATPAQAAHLGHQGLQVVARAEVRQNPSAQAKSDVFKEIGCFVTGRIADGFFSEQDNRGADEPFIT